MYTADMSEKQNPSNRHYRLQASHLKKIAAIGPFVEGTLSEFTRKGRKSSSWRLTYKVKGKTQSVYVPVDMVEEVKRWIQEYKRLKELIKKESQESLAIIRGHVASRQAANRSRSKKSRPS